MICTLAISRDEDRGPNSLPRCGECAGVGDQGREGLDVPGAEPAALPEEGAADSLRRPPLVTVCGDRAGNRLPLPPAQPSLHLLGLLALLALVGLRGLWQRPRRPDSLEAPGDWERLRLGEGDGEDSLPAPPAESESGARGARGERRERERPIAFSAFSAASWEARGPGVARRPRTLLGPAMACRHRAEVERLRYLVAVLGSPGRPGGLPRHGCQPCQHRTPQAIQN